MNIRLFGVSNDSIVDGPGIRYAIFVQGCPHNCLGCHNPKSHSFTEGYLENTDTLLKNISLNPLLDGVTFSGGEPFCQAKPLIQIAKQVHKKGLNVMTYTGYTFEYLYKCCGDMFELLKNTDILVDGLFDLSQRSIDLKFKGSKNQRIIDVKKSLDLGTVVLLDL